MDLPVMPPVKPMLAKPVAAIPPDMQYEAKWDGFRAIVFRDGVEVELGSRTGKPLTRYFPELVEALRERLPERCVVDGEIVIAREGRLDFDALTERIHPADSRVRMLAQKTPASFVAFDLLALDDDSLLDVPLGRRRALLERALSGVSNFARMPKPVFREENIHEIARAALFLHEVAHPGMTFSIDPPHADIRLVCDRRQLSQALTNVVKNAVEAIETRRHRGESSFEGDKVAVKVRETGGQVVIDVTDTGIGLPEDRERLTEPYMTTRVRGTGLGLAIVKKIVEEHMGEIAFLDRAGGGTHVRIAFDGQRLAALADDEDGAQAARRGEDGEYDEEVEEG
jgi:signal transduction histidine kinase